MLSFICIILISTKYNLRQKSLVHYQTDTLVDDYILIIFFLTKHWKESYRFRWITSILCWQQFYMALSYSCNLLNLLLDLQVLAHNLPWLKKEKNPPLKPSFNFLNCAPNSLLVQILPMRFCDDVVSHIPTLRQV